MERLTQILSMLAGAEGHTLTADELLQVVPYGAERVEDQRDQLRRDVRHLETLGWEIANTAPDGGTARYRLTAVDNRLRVEFTPEQRTELLRVASAASLSELVDQLGGGTGEALDSPDEMAVLTPRQTRDLSLVQRAVSQHCRLEFSYRGKRRVVDPQGLYLRSGGWYLTAVEDAATDPKTFVVARMSDLHIGNPGSAPVPDGAARPQLDPISWLIDPPLAAVVRTSEQHRGHVEELLGAATSVLGIGADLELTIPVTHRAAFRRRLYELGSRVVLVAPEEIRDEVRNELRAVVGEDT